MHANFYWLLIGSAVAVWGAWIGYRAYKRSGAKAEFKRSSADAGARAEAQGVASEEAVARGDTERRAAADEAARAAAAKLVETKAARIEASRVAAEAASRESAARAAVEAAAREEAAQETIHRDAAARDAALREEAARQTAARAEAARVDAARNEAARADAARAEVARNETLRAEQARLVIEEAARAEAIARAEAAARAEAGRSAAEIAARREGPAPESAPVLPTRPVQTPLSPGRVAKPPDQTLVMVADDSKIVRVKTGRLLAKHRYRVTYAVDGRDAAEQMQTSVPDVMITDVEMPGMDGFELTRHVRGNPLTAHIPIIMITAADDRHREDASRAGVSVLLGKPYPEEELIGYIRAAMQAGATLAGALA